jgi:hypothetical protein
MLGFLIFEFKVKVDFIGFLKDVIGFIVGL